MTIRPAAEADLPALRVLFAETYADTFGAPAPDFTTVTEGEHILLAEADGLAGFVTIWVPDRFVHFLMVDKACRMRGTGRMLLSAAAECIGSPLTLKCLLANENALAFYRRDGWHEIGRGNSEDGAYALLEKYYGK